MSDLPPEVRAMQVLQEKIDQAFSGLAVVPGGWKVAALNPPLPRFRNFADGDELARDISRDPRLLHHDRTGEAFREDSVTVAIPAGPDLLIPVFGRGVYLREVWKPDFCLVEIPFEIDLVNIDRRPGDYVVTYLLSPTVTGEKKDGNETV